MILPDGKILTYGTDQDGNQGAFKIYDVWDPVTNTHNTLPNPTLVDEFCSAGLIIPTTGQVLIAGGDARPLGSVNKGVPNTNIFDPTTETLTPTGPMAFARWYPTMITLNTGQLLIIGGIDLNGNGVTTPEIYTAGVGWRTLTGANIPEFFSNPLYPRTWQASNGKVITVGTNGISNVYAIDPTGNGQVTVVGQTPVNFDFNEPAIMFAQDRCLILASNGSCWTMNISGSTPVFTQTGSLAADRIWSNLTVLPDGRVMVSGGSAVDNQLTGVDNTVAIWDPSTGVWTSTGANAAVPRLYHSTAVLLPDATILSLGGGAPGPLNNLNGEIYTPGYLFDASGAPAVRPVIQQAPPGSQSRPNVHRAGRQSGEHPHARVDAVWLRPRIPSIQLRDGSNSPSPCSPTAALASRCRPIRMSSRPGIGCCSQSATTGRPPSPRPSWSTRRRPSVTINQAAGQADPTSASPINFTVTFSETVTGFAAGDISFAGSTVGGTLTATVTGTGPTYNVAVSGMTGSGSVVVSVPAGAATDAAGNASLASTSTDNSVTFGTVDTTAPTVQSINRVGTTPTNAASVSWTVLFSESVTGVDASDFALATTGAVTGATITGVSGSGSQYTVTANTGTGSGTLGLNLVDNDSILDASANPLGGTGAGNGNFTGQSYTIDKTQPSVTINQAAGQADPTSASPINFTVTFSETVTGFAAGDISFAGSTVGGTLTATVTGTGPTYNVAVSGMTGTGTRGGERPGRGGDGCGGQRQPCVDEHGQ